MPFVRPVFVNDVARAFVHCLGDAASCGQSYDLCGPRVYTLREIVELVAAVTGRRRLIIGLNDALSYLQALLLELSPVKMMTRDNYYSMKLPSVCGCEFPFGIAPRSLEEIAPGYLPARTRHEVAYRTRAERERRFRP